MFSKKSDFKVSYTACQDLFLCRWYEYTVPYYICCYFCIFLTAQILYSDLCSFWSSDLIDCLFCRESYESCCINREEYISILEPTLFCRRVFEYFLYFYSFWMFIYNRSDSFEISLECIFEFSGFFRWEIRTMFISEGSDERGDKTIFHFYFCFFGKVVKFVRDNLLCFFYFMGFEHFLLPIFG